MRVILRLLLIVGAGVAAFRLLVLPWWKAWGYAPDEATKPLAGDDIVEGGTTAETRGITIDAPPAAVWPWLVQMGYGRAGWYSYDQVDMNRPSAREILPEHQSLSVGDVVPTHPAGGFVVKAIEPNRHLVLFMDTELAAEQAKAAADADPTPTNVRMAGAFMEGAQPTDFAVSWAFVLEEREHDRTRLIERVRVKFGAADKPWTRFTMPVMGFGVFVMIRRQLLGIRDRAQRSPARSPEAVAA